MLTSTVYLIGPFLLKELSTFLTYIGLSIFFNLNSYFLTNFKLITNPVASLSKNAFTITPFCISTLSSPIFTVTSLKKSPLSRLQVDILFTILESTANLLLSKYNWELLDFPSCLNYSVHYYECPHILSSFLGL